MNAEIDVFISNYTLIDSDIFQQWIEGYSCKKKNTTNISVFNCIIYIRSIILLKAEVLRTVYGCPHRLNSFRYIGSISHVFLNRAPVVRTHKIV